MPIQTPPSFQWQAPGDPVPTRCWVEGEELKIAHPTWGSVCCTRAELVREAYPAQGIDPADFERFVVHSWLPLVHCHWGAQSLHASAVTTRSTGAVWAFAAPSGTGKSTLAFALGHRPGLAQISDDSLVFRNHGGRIELVAVPFVPNLRPDSSELLDSPGSEIRPVPADAVRKLAAIVLLAPPTQVAEQEEPILSPALRADSFPKLLALAQTLPIPGYFSRATVARDYLELAAQVPLFSLTYPRQFSGLHALLDLLQERIAAEEIAHSRGVGKASTGAPSSPDGDAR